MEVIGVPYDTLVNGVWKSIINLGDGVSATAKAPNN
jgi:hypothetical protein